MRLSAVSAFCHPESPAAGSPGNSRRDSAAPSPKSGQNHARESLAGCPIHVAAAVSAIAFVVVVTLRRAKTNGSATVSCSNRKKKKEESGRPSGRATREPRERNPMLGQDRPRSDGAPRRQRRRASRESSLRCLSFSALIGPVSPRLKIVVVKPYHHIKLFEKSSNEIMQRSSRTTTQFWT